MPIPHDLLRLLFPSYCASCGRPLTHAEQTFCLACRLSFPRHQEGAAARHIIAIREVVAADAWLKFSHGGNVATLILDAKYHGLSQVLQQLAGAWVAERGAHLLMPSSEEGEPQLPPVSIVVPVPLSPKKRRSRGYNQSQFVAEGICKAWNTDEEHHPIHIEADSLIRHSGTTQTHDDSLGRQRNVEGMFSVRRPERLAGKHVLLVDDVLTTGSTLNECIRTLADNVPDIRISVFAVAMV